MASALRRARPVMLTRVMEAMNAIAPLELAASWDNVGLLLDTTREDYPRPCNLLVTNDLTEKVVDEAVRKGAHIIVSYHPTPFLKTRTLLRTDPQSRIMMACVQHGIAVYAPHTALDCTADGLTDWLIEGCGATSSSPVVPSAIMEGAGMGRVATLDAPVSLASLVDRLKHHLGIPHVRVAVAQSALEFERADQASVAAAAETLTVRTVAVCAGSGGSILSDAADVDVWVTGEMSHHEILAANHKGISVLLTDHSNTERGYLPVLAERLSRALGDDAKVVVTEVDADPLVVM